MSLPLKITRGSLRSRPSPSCAATSGGRACDRFARTVCEQFEIVTNLTGSVSHVEQILEAALAILTWSDACDGARFLTPCYDQSDDPMAQHHRATQRAFHPGRVAPCCARGVGTCSATAFRFSICKGLFSRFAWSLLPSSWVEVGCSYPLGLASNLALAGVFDAFLFEDGEHN